MTDVACGSHHSMVLTNEGEVSRVDTLPGIMSENILMCKIAHFLTVLCAILSNSVRNFYVLTRYTIIDAKIAHSLSKLCAIFEFNVKNRASRGPNPIPALLFKMYLFRLRRCDVLSSKKTHIL